MERADVIMLCLAGAVLILLYFLYYYKSSPPVHSQSSSQKSYATGTTRGSTSGSTSGSAPPPRLSTQGSQTALQQPYPLGPHTSKPFPASSTSALSSAPSSSLVPSRNNPSLMSGLKPQQPQQPQQPQERPASKPSDCVPCGGLNVGSSPGAPSKIPSPPLNVPLGTVVSEHITQTHIPDVGVSSLQQTQETEIIENNREAIMVTLSPSKDLFQEVLFDAPTSGLETVMMPQSLPVSNSNNRSQVNMGSCDARSCMSLKTEPDTLVLGGSMTFGSQTWDQSAQQPAAAVELQPKKSANQESSSGSSGSPLFTLTKRQPFFTVRYYFSPSCPYCVQFATEWEKLQLSFGNNPCVQFETINGSPTNPVGKQQADDALINGERGVKYFPMVTVSRGNDKDEYVLRTANEKADELIPRIQQLCRESGSSQH